MLLDDVSDEINALHDEFVLLLTGASTTADRVAASLADDFLFVGPDGSIVAASSILDGLLSGGPADVAIRVEDVNVQWQRGDLVCATYEEWQVHAGSTTVRQSSVVLEANEQAPGGFTWLSVHETWLPDRA